MCWLAWDKLTKPKGTGGLGLRDIQIFNQALLAKIAWRILTAPNCLLARVLTGKYCHKKSFLDVKVPAVCSHGWRSILHGRDLLQENLGKAIGNVIDLRVSDLLTDSLQWNKERIDKLLPGFGHLIQQIKPSKEGVEDIYVWLPLTSGVYSTKSGYNSRNQSEGIATSQDMPPNLSLPLEFSWIKDIWSVKTAPKLILFLWSIAQGALPLGKELQRRGINTDTQCPCCKEEETAMHVFFQCPFAKEVWRLAPLSSPVHLAAEADFQDLAVMARTIVCLPPTGVRVPILPWIVWFLWLARNKLIFENKTAQPMEIITKSIAAALEWNQAQDNAKEKEALPMKTNRLQEANAARSHRCSVDAAWDSNRNRAGIAWRLTGSHLAAPLSGTRIIEDVGSPLMAEALALQEGIARARDLGFSPVSFYSDCATLIRAISSQNQVKEIYGVLQDIKALSSSFDSIGYLHIPRSQNSDVDLLAKKALKASFVSSILMG
ncbi:uncharacterized protein LOC108820218 [Raphanus sativus]|uniref:Uncharacterized protein LOC108820218 n=1 Tax=Raphanus sativus TaxID=3726 RepID=A0A9W3CBS3_RAPSA|nr:uncharacterized protein LOC108820218 [Raphanus sativus]